MEPQAKKLIEKCMFNASKAGWYHQTWLLGLLLKQSLTFEETELEILKIRLSQRLK